MPPAENHRTDIDHHTLNENGAALMDRAVFDL